MKYKFKKKIPVQSDSSLMSSPEIEQASKDGIALPNIKPAGGMLSQKKASLILTPMILVAGILLSAILFGAITNIMKEFDARKENERKVDALIKANNSLLANSIIYSSDIYSLSITTDEWLQYNHPDDTKYGIISVSDMGHVIDVTEAESVILRNTEEYSTSILNITDTDSFIYQQRLPAFEIKNDVAYMAVLYYYNDETGHLYNITHSNTPEYYEESRAKAIKDILSIRFE